jgi:3-deoxy-D-manno-octulosonic-acid transferase
MRLLLTHGTATGRAEGRGLLREGDIQVWQPWDTPQATRKFLVLFKPDVGVLMETEVWPNLMAACRAAQVPVVLANARLSEASFARARRFALLARPAYSALAAALPQTEDDARRLKALGAPVRAVTGNLKHDAEPDPELLAAGRRLKAQARKPIVVFASSREGEEGELFKWLRPADAGRDATTSGADLAHDALHAVQWLVVPRHPQRFQSVAELAQMQHLRVSERSAWGAAPDRIALPPELDRPEVWIGDSLGEMALYYGMAELALLGGSFKPLGGQNLIEAIACGCPVVMGPSTFNFEQAAREAQARGAAVRVADLGEAVQRAVQLATDPPRMQLLRQAGANFSASYRGAAEATAQAIAAVLARRRGAAPAAPTQW